MWGLGVDEGLRSGSGAGDPRHADPGRAGYRLRTVCCRSFRVARDRSSYRKGHITVRATTLLNGLLDLPGITARGVSLPQPGELVVAGALRPPRPERPGRGGRDPAPHARRRGPAGGPPPGFGPRPGQIPAPP